MAPVLLYPHLGIGLDDMFQYDMLARSLAAGNGFRWYAPPDAAYLAPYLNWDLAALNLDPRGIVTTFRAPLYPAILALVYRVFGAGPDRFLAPRILQSALGAALAPLTYLAAQTLLARRPSGEGASEWISRSAAVIVAIYPMLIFYPLGLATENLFFPLVLASTLALLALAQLPTDPPAAPLSPNRTLALAALAGLLLGLSALTRSVILPFAVVALLWIWLDLRQPRAAAVSALVLVCTIAPWIVRNSIVAGRPTGIETSMGYNLYLGYHPASTGSFSFGPSLDLLSILDDSERDQVGTHRALEFIRNDPARFPSLALLRLGHFFDLEWRAFTYFYSNGLLGTLAPGLIVLILSLLSIPFALLAIAAAFGLAQLPAGSGSRLPYLLLLAYLLPHVLILSEERFHLALIPLFAILGSLAWTRRSQIIRAGGVSSWAPLGAVLLLVLNWSLQLWRSWPTFVALVSPGGSSLHLPY